MIKKNILNVIMGILTSTYTYAATHELDLEDIKDLISSSSREDEDIKSYNIKNIRKIISVEGVSLTDEEITRFVNLPFYELRSLDLSHNSFLTDKHIKKLSENSKIKRLCEINLSNCPHITDKSLTYILESEYIGKIRILPQISDRYGIPVSSINIIISGKTGISEEMKRKGCLGKRGFEIIYQPSNGGESSFPPASNALKILELEF